MQQRHRQNECTVVPIRDIDVTNPSAGECREKYGAEGHPNDRDENIDEPLRLGVLLALRKTSGMVTIASTSTVCQPQKVKVASGPNAA